MVDVLLGLQWGDEGKGKIVDYFAGRYDVIARFQGGPNAGHTLYVNGQKVVLRTIPSGVFHDKTINLIGNGVVLDPVAFKKESEDISALGVDLTKNLFIAEKTHIIVPTHRALDKASEIAKGNDKIGSTLKGIGPAYMDKTGRNGLRVGDVLSPDFKTLYEKLKQKHLQLLCQYDINEFSEDIANWEAEFFEAIPFLQKMNVVSGEYFLNEKLKAGKKVLAEGAQGSMLDVDFGTYPFVTSSNTISAGVCTGLGIAPQWIKEVIGVTKAYCTRVGSGPFPTELHDATGEKLRSAGHEFGAVTGRPRRCGWIDLVALNYTCMLSGVTQLVMTKSDVLDEFDEVLACTAYEIDGKQTKQLPFQINGLDIKPVWETFKGWSDKTSTCQQFNELPAEMKAFVTAVDSYLGVPVKYVSNGPGRDQILEK
ncbi:Adenylosuccinate synthetase [Chitinophaga ginsengisegetis]|uniref:Adenylosuccinate synthetase n=1 Tax=Chitinophaga ginsengisegetis TaxID=393003 RepID=A0A1T5NMT4_9BACT|nr:adenylosuccinate synthase [Chitinophaga ginsengisegetis]MDR6565384.1 adenylosuccinate synthase [Chitinophaga ginsengisegetis]MDR6645112.1 adenylosuccinate synthase [Chitinophaga ginsengisegetis]MDR6652296.1 adenylosuccinate synthase [Chitinophaga ginsengisegetis]SKD01667.1 Adenylosuccinate synthetase [Chitinophaga ginsengisegetis]